jgi:CheY-like chemotaxis protein/methyl-accepting chemotaxis protein/putative methionine-R-sulfoxide reductase with GAF domain
MKGNFIVNFIRKWDDSLFKVIRQRGLGKTLFLWFLTLSLLPLLAASIISSMTASRILQDDAMQSLNSASKLKTEYINSFFTERINDMQLMSRLSSSVNVVKDITNYFKKSGSSLRDFVDSYKYDEYTLEIGLDLDNFQKTYNYKDIYLMDLEGNILYALQDEDMAGNNAHKGDYKDTLFSKACKKALKTDKPLFSDLEYFGPEDNKEIAGFLIQLMKENNTPLGIMAIRIELGNINKMMQENTEASKTGETYLVGTDLLMRSASRFEKESTLLKTKVDTDGSRDWLKQLEKSKNENDISLNDKIDTYTNYRNIKVLGMHYELESLQELGVRWGLIAEISESEAFYSVSTLRWISILIMIATISIVSLISIFVARRIVEPIRKLSTWAQRVAIGDLSYEKITSEKNEIGEMSNSFETVVDSFQAVTDVCETIALGDFSKTVAIRSDKDALGKAVNQMEENLVDVVRQADNISMGDYSGEVIPRSQKDMLGIALERMTRTLRDAAALAEEVSIGDYSLKMDVKGEKDMLGNAMNQMIERLKESNMDSQRKIDYLHNIPTPVHVIDNDYNVRFINKSGATIVGKTVDECIGKKCYALFNTGHCRTEKCRSHRAMNQGKVLTGDTVAHLPEKDIPMRYTSAPLMDDGGAVIGAIEYMVDINDEMQVVELAERISRGDYSVNVQKRSDDDRLSDALNRMTYSLREAVEQSERQNWLKTGHSELNNRMRGELDIPELSRNIISYLTTYLDAQLGLLYFASNADTLKLVGSYALGKEKGIMKKFKFGEGIVGQAAQENQAITIDNIPDDAIKVRSGAGEIIPRNIIVVPFSYEGNVIGVIEIVSIHRIIELQKDFLMQSLENISIALNSAESRRQLEELLGKTQEQAERLQAQQEELRQSNEELEGQTKALIASETNLQSQQEELRVINEELEERTRALEKQKADIQQKNKELLIARNEIGKKARDLEEVSKYKSEFLANMSHELRTPLNSILILSQLLSNNAGNNLSGKQVEFSKTIHSSGSDLLALINEILDLSKIEAGMMEIRIEKILVDDFSGNINRVFKPVASNKGLNFIMDVEKDILPEYFYTDSQRAQQVVKNLLSNAFKFTDEGSVTLHVYRPTEATVLAQSGLNPVESIAFAVRDTGIGIPEDKQNIIFEAFRQEDGTTSRKYGGTGLGLSISRELAVLLGGEIQMKSKKGEGSTFTLFLPEKLESPGKKNSQDRYKMKNSIEDQEDQDLNETVISSRSNGLKQEAAVKKSSKGITAEQFLSDDIANEHEVRDDRRDIRPGEKSLLIIEDDTAFSEVLLGLAQSRGFKTIIAEDGETGLHFADFYKPSAIILDIGLPGISGWEVMDRLKRNPDTRHIPVHFMSAADDSSAALKMGAIGYLSKPVNTESIEHAFGKIDHVLSKPVKKLLVVDNDEIERKSISELVGSSDVAIVSVSSGKEALELLKEDEFDSIVINPNLKDMPGFKLLEKIKDDPDIENLPIIVYSEKTLSKKEQQSLDKYAKNIVIKDVKSPERLFAETTLFLHRVESEMPESKQRLLSRMVSKEDVLKEKKILVVDDDMRNVFALTSILEESGLRTIVGKNGKEGLEKLQEDPSIDLVLMDIMMPVMDGYEAMKAIRKDKNHSKLPIIALTAKAMKGDRSKCVAAGASDYLAKPVDSAKLLSLLRVWLYQSK